MGELKGEPYIPTEVLDGLAKLRSKHKELSDDRALDKRIEDVGADVAEMKRVAKQYRQMAERGTDAGRQAKVLLDKLESTIRSKEDEIKELESLRGEKERSGKILHDQAKLFVLSTLAGSGTVINPQDVIEKADAMRRELQQKMTRIEVPIGEFIGYAVMGKVSRGGFAEIYKVRKDGKYYALKAPKDADLTGSLTLHLTESMLRDFEKEAKVWTEACRVSPKSVVSLIAYDSSPFPWFLMEYMDGGSLRERVKNLSAEDACRHTSDILGVLGTLHQANIIHRDIKPENVLFNSEGAMKLTDFGLGRIINESTSTKDGYKGTIQYSAPEQFAAEQYGPVGPHTDVYQAGALLYEMLTAHPPFKGDTAQVIAAILNTAPAPPSKLNPKVPRQLDPVVLKALAKRKEERWQNCDEFKREIENVLAKEVPEA
ncbi:MAG: protein kinase [Candidatus Thermoplasmatota archaeon]